MPRPKRPGLVTLLLSASLLAACGNDPPRLERSEETTVLTLRDERIRESSGLAVSVKHEGVLYTHNDRGHGPKVYAIGPDGRTLATIDLEGAPAVDWEDIAVTEDGRVWIGDIGGNPSGRDTISVITFEEPDELRDVAPRWTSYELEYPDGAHNAEALLVRPYRKRVHVVTKAPASEAAVYVAPAELDPSAPNLLERTPYRVPPSITGGDFAPDGSGGLVLRNYNRAFLYEELGDTARTVELPSVPKGESIALLDTGDLLIGSEGRGAKVLRVEVPDPEEP